MGLFNANSSVFKFACLASFLASAFYSPNAISYNGQADHRLVVIDQTLTRHYFDPNQDLTVASVQEKRWDSFRQVVMRSALESLLPLVSYIKGNHVTEHNNILQSILNTASLSYRFLADAALQSLKTNQDLLPFKHDIYLLPFTDSERNLFYSDEKISVSGISQLNLLGIASESSATFTKTVTENIKKLQTKYLESDQPFSLLAFRRSIIISSLQQRMSYYFLIQLKAREESFVKNSDRVNLKRMVIPDFSANKGSPAVALITLDLDFNTKGEKPQVKIEFGTFDRYENGEFLLSKVDDDKSIPRLEGDAVGRLGKLIKLSFGFKELTLDLNTQQLSSLDLYTRPGLNIGGAKPIAPIFFNAESVDEEFKKEINKTLKEEIKRLMDKLFGSEGRVS